MSEFITDVERQYELYCKIAEEHGFIDLNAKKNGFRCTAKSNEFNAGWIAFAGAVAVVRDEQQATIDNLKTQLNNMESCYIQKKKEYEGLQDRADGVLGKMLTKAESLQQGCDGYIDPVELCQAEGIEMCMRFLEKALRGGDQNTKNKAQSTENIGHEGGDQKAMIEAQEQNR